MPRVNYGFKGRAILPTEAASFGGIVQASTYAYESTYGRLEPLLPPGVVTDFAASDATLVVVDVRVNGWVSGPTVAAGQLLTITATGVVTWNSSGGTSTPDGVPGNEGASVDARFPHESLIGRIDGGPAFLIGSHASVTAPATGTLQMRQNDVIVGDNNGFYYATVRLAGTAFAALGWKPPASVGSSPVTGYVVRYSTDGGLSWIDQQSTAGTSLTVSGLKRVTNYLFQVAATNAVGVGDFSPASLTTSAAMPAAPVNVVGTPRDQSVDLSWQPPSDDGGAAVTDYVIQVSADNGTTWTTFNDGASAATKTSVTGLVNGSGYSFRVAASNSAGTSAYSSPTAPVVPAVPGVLTESGDVLCIETGELLLW